MAADLIGFDACVLVDALCNHRTLEFKLLDLAAAGVPFAGFTTEICGFELRRNAHEGVNGGRTFSDDQIDEFLDVFDPLFAADNIRTSPIGRALTRDPALLGAPLAKAIERLTGKDGPALRLEIEGIQPTLNFGKSIRHFDPADLHLVLAALDAGATHICTSNTNDYSMGSIGPIAIVTPTELADEYGLS